MKYGTFSIESGEAWIVKLSIMMLLLLPGLTFSQMDDKQSQNGNAEIGFIGGASIPLGYFSDQESASLNGGFYIAFPISAHRDKLVFEFSFLFSNADSDVNHVVSSYGFNVTKSLTVINAYLRCDILPTLFIDSGCGFYFPKVSPFQVHEPDAIRKASFGLCLGPTFQLTRSALSNIYLSTKFHTYQAEEDWEQMIRMNVQIAFSLHY